MKKSKKILVALLAGLIVGTSAIGFAACGFLNNGGGFNPSQPSSSSSSNSNSSSSSTTPSMPNDGQTQQKQVPVYQGMTISSPMASKMLMAPMSYRFTSSMAASSNSRKDDNGNHYGQYKGDHNGKEETIDEENPFPDNDDKENIENEIESSLPLRAQIKIFITPR